MEVRGAGGKAVTSFVPFAQNDLSPGRWPVALQGLLGPPLTASLEAGVQHHLSPAVATSAPAPSEPRTAGASDPLPAQSSFPATSAPPESLFRLTSPFKTKGSILLDKLPCDFSQGQWKRSNLPACARYRPPPPRPAPTWLDSHCDTENWVLPPSSCYSGKS
uniref:Uncharacterized protein n=1 Tax=Mustela putorius furo TaxID=9669 RepID=M3YIM7_MUSPF